MSIKEIAYAAKQQLELETLQSFSHTHVHELLAACFGYKSKAALHSSCVFVVMSEPMTISTEHALVLRRRLVELGYKSVDERAGAALLQTVEMHRLGVIEVDAILSVFDPLRDEDTEWEAESWDAEDLSDDSNQAWAAGEHGLDLSSMGLLISELEDVARKNHLKAHQALVFIYRSMMHEVGSGSEHWYSALLQGASLTGVQLEWAHAYGQSQLFAQREAYHLQEAARLGCSHCRLELVHAAALEAEEKMDFEGAKRCYLDAATLGDTQAMRVLIHNYDSENVFQNWVWIHLSRLLGDDLRQSSLRAYHDGGLYHGQEYDDDQGGPLYVAGDEGVELPDMSADKQLEASRIAEEMFKKLVS